MSTLQRLRERPEHHRKLIAFVVSGAFTLVIFTGWALSIPAQFGPVASVASPMAPHPVASSQSSALAGAAAAVDTSPFDALQKNFSQGVAMFQSIGSSVGTLFSSEKPITPASLQVVPPKPSVNSSADGVVIYNSTSTGDNSF